MFTKTSIYCNLYTVRCYTHLKTHQTIILLLLVGKDPITKTDTVFGSLLDISFKTMCTWCRFP